MLTNLDLTPMLISPCGDVDFRSILKPVLWIVHITLFWCIDLVITIWDLTLLIFYPTVISRVLASNLSYHLDFAGGPPALQGQIKLQSRPCSGPEMARWIKGKMGLIIIEKLRKPDRMRG